jgi:hypothetical protein
LAEGRKLSRTWWPFCAELLDESKQSEIEEFFDDAQV